MSVFNVEKLFNVKQITNCDLLHKLLTCSWLTQDSKPLMRPGHISPCWLVLCSSVVSCWHESWVHPLLSPVVHSSQSRVQIRSCWCSWRPCCVYVGVCSHSSYPVKSARGVPPHRCVALVLLSDSVVAAVVSVWSNWCNGFEVYPKANYLSVQLTTMHECECVKGREVVNFLFPVQQKTIGLVKNTCVLKCEMC